MENIAGMETEMIKCWCGNEDLKEYSADYYKCDKCHTLISKHNFQDTIYDVKNEEDDLYGKNYWEVTMTRAAGKNTLSEVVDLYLTGRVIYWLKNVLKYIKLGADIAEIGCGLGQLQYVLKRIEYNQLAFELSSEICGYMERELGIQAHCGPFEKRENSYDGILAFDLFEHLLEPEQFIENCACSLRKDGVLCFQTPCYDDNLTYEDMLREKPRFKEQLKTEQHIYLYSKKAITDLLRKHGFENIIFKPSYFGDDYDMFLFASKSEIKENTDELIDAYLNSVKSGRIVKAMITLFDEREELQKKYLIADEDRNERLKSITSLEKMLEESEKDRAARLEQINVLSEQVKEFEKRYEEADEDRVERLENIKQLEEMLKQNGENSGSDQDAIKELVEQNRELSQRYAEADRDREEHLKNINILEKALKESEADRAARLEQVNKLTELLKNTENAR